MKKIITNPLFLSVLSLASFVLINESMYFPLIILLVNIMISGIIANSVKNREISQAKTFYISLFLSPIIAMFVAAMSPIKK